MRVDGLRLQPLQLADEAAVRSAHEAMAAEEFVFALGYDPTEAWAGYVERLERVRVGTDLPERWVPSTFLVADVGGQIVGRASIRHELNDFLAREGGHIGYGVVRQHRRHGYATEILRQSLELARGMGIERALVTCDDDNVGSATVIERAGGRLESVIVGEAGNRMRRYWIG